MLFTAEISDFKIIQNVLKAITFNEFVIVRPMEEGLKFTLDEMRYVETSAYVPKNMFSAYTVNNEEDIAFKISMKVFTECLNIFGDDDNSSLKLSYRAIGSPFYLIMKHNDENITVDCEIRTMSVDDAFTVSLAEECNLNKVVINADMFLELLQRLDNSSDEIQICIEPNVPFFTLSSNGVAGDSRVSISKHSDSITLFKCNEKIVSLYAFSNIRQILKVMNFADKVAVSTGSSGLLGLQLVINSNEKQIYVEYYVVSHYVND